MSGFPEKAWMVKFDGDSLVHIVVTFRIWHEDDSWQGVCSELGVPSFGDTQGEALSSVTEATLDYLNSIEESGDRERIFRERKIKVQKGLPGEDDSVQEKVDPNVTISRLGLSLAECG